MKKFLFISFLFSICISSIYAQDKVETALKILSEKYPQEKIYLLYNKDSYLAGETIWFKAFVFDGYNHSNISTSMYVEMYNAKNR